MLNIQWGATILAHIKVITRPDFHAILRNQLLCFLLHFWRIKPGVPTGSAAAEATLRNHTVAWTTEQLPYAEMLLKRIPSCVTVNTAGHAHFCSYSIVLLTGIRTALIRRLHLAMSTIHTVVY